MAKKRINKKHIEQLGHKADLAYNALKEAIVGGKPWFFSSVENSVDRLYKQLGEYLAYLTPTKRPERLNKGGTRARQIEKFILQWVLVGNPSSKTTGRIEINEDPNDGLGGLKAYLDAKDDRSTPEGELFRRISGNAKKLKEEGNYSLVFNALEYVRKNYT